MLTEGMSVEKEDRVSPAETKLRHAEIRPSGQARGEIHLLSVYNPEEKVFETLCEKYGGRTSGIDALTDDPVTCEACLRKDL